MILQNPLIDILLIFSKIIIDTYESVITVNIKT